MERAGQRLDADADAGSAEGQEPWGIAGLMALCGRPDGPALAPPRRVVDTARQLTVEVEQRSAQRGQRVSIDPVRVLVERAALNGLRRRGEVSCGGSAHLIRSADGWVAVNLARPDDWDLVDAWLMPSSPIAVGRWTAVADEVSGQSAEALVSRSTLLGLPVASLGERGPDASRWGRSTSGAAGTAGMHGVLARCVREGVPPAALDDLLIVDLSALWAGPLAGILLHRAGARVVKVESWSRPDGARRGSPAFFAALNHGKASVALDFDTPDGRRRLGALVARADVVITAARPRALARLGLGPADHGAGRRPKVWLSITGYGASGPSADRVAFGDDAAVAGGLVVWDDRGPCFCGDAIADPLSGMAAAVSVLAALVDGGGWVIDVSMADVAAGCSGTEPAAADGPAPGPSGPERLADAALPTVPTMPALGADTESVLSELGIG
jgi:hypothetical protein